MFAHPLFSKFHNVNKTTKSKGVNVDITPTLIGIVCRVEIAQFKFVIIKGI